MTPSNRWHHNNFIQARVSQKSLNTIYLQGISSMGVIKKVLHRDNNAISKPRHSRIFLDMEENIHIHYRDLRIELSLPEFEEFVSSFNVQSKELMRIIKKANIKMGYLLMPIKMTSGYGQNQNCIMM